MVADPFGAPVIPPQDFGPNFGHEFIVRIAGLACTWAIIVIAFFSICVERGLCETESEGTDVEELRDGDLYPAVEV